MKVNTFNEAPSIVVDTCTHYEAKNNDQSIVDTCKSKTDKSLCNMLLNCHWITQAYKLEKTNGGCHDAATLKISKLDDKYYTTETCY
jgi:hypothetical protein